MKCIYHFFGFLISGESGSGKSMICRNLNYILKKLKVSKKEFKLWDSLGLIKRSDIGDLTDNECSSEDD